MATSWKIAVEEAEHPAFAAHHHLALKWPGTKLLYGGHRESLNWFDQGHAYWHGVVDCPLHQEIDSAVLLVEGSWTRTPGLHWESSVEIDPSRWTVEIELTDVADLTNSLLAALKWGTKAQRLTTPDQAWVQYVEKVKIIPEVQKVWLTADTNEPTIWTLISATPFDKATRHRVYQAQIEVIRASDQPIVDFRLVNLNELPESSKESIVPRDSKNLWEK